MKNFFQANGGMLAVLAVCFALGAGYLEWRIAVAVDAKFVAAGSVAPHRMNQAEDDIDDLEDADIRIDAKAERIVQILLEE